MSVSFASPLSLKCLVRNFSYNFRFFLFDFLFCVVSVYNFFIAATAAKRRNCFKQFRDKQCFGLALYLLSLYEKKGEKKHCEHRAFASKVFACHSCENQVLVTKQTKNKNNNMKMKNNNIVQNHL